MTKREKERKVFLTERFRELYDYFSGLCDEGTLLPMGKRKYSVTDLEEEIDSQESRTSVFRLEFDGGDIAVSIELNATLPLIEITMFGDTQLSYVRREGCDSGNALLRMTYRLPEAEDEKAYLKIKDKSWHIDYPTPEMADVLEFLTDKLLEYLQVKPSEPFLWYGLREYVRKQHDIYKMVKKKRGEMNLAFDILSKQWDELFAACD